MPDLVGNPEDRFSRIAAQIECTIFPKTDMVSVVV